MTNMGNRVSMMRSVSENKKGRANVRFLKCSQVLLAGFPVGIAGAFELLTARKARSITDKCIANPRACQER